MHVEREAERVEAGAEVGARGGHAHAHAPAERHAVERGALAAREESGGYIGAIEDAEILRAQRLLASSTGVFVEPASAISVAGLLERHAAGDIPSGSTVTLTVTGHGLKDAAWGLRLEDGSDATPESADADTTQVAQMLGLA